MYEAIPRSNHFLSASNTGECMGKGLQNKTVKAIFDLNCSYFGLVNAFLSSFLNEPKSFNLAKCEWLSISLE